VQIWKLEGKSGNGSANLETLGQFRKLKVKSRNLSVNLEIECKSGNTSANPETQVKIQKPMGKSGNSNEVRKFEVNS
jgi:hypothetical protein